MPGATVLITDDAPFMPSMHKGILIPTKCAVVEACSGLEAVEQFNAYKPDMDIAMAGIDGISTTKSIRELDPQAVIVMYSAMGQQAMVVEAVRAGARDFKVKPFKPERVLECVKQHAPERAA